MPSQGAGVLSCSGLGHYNLLRVTPSAKRNSYRVAWLVGVATQGSVLRPQPWAGESQHLQRGCCLRKTLFIFTRTAVVWEGGVWVAWAAPSPWEGTEKLKTTIKLKVDDGEIAVLPFIICLF